MASGCGSGDSGLVGSESQIAKQSQLACLFVGGLRSQIWPLRHNGRRISQSLCNPKALKLKVCKSAKRNNGACSNKRHPKADHGWMGTSERAASIGPFVGAPCPFVSSLTKSTMRPRSTASPCAFALVRVA